MSTNPSEKFYPHYWTWSLVPQLNAPSRSLTHPSPLHKRTFTCTTGAHACDNINRGGMCCNDTEDCVKIPDVGYGDVGCCVKGDSCSGNLSGCGEGKISCDIRIGGGCCNDGALCSPSGCIDAGEEPEDAPNTETPAGNKECPAGFLKCGEDVGGGCCREGRSCEATACPAADQPTGTVVEKEDAVCAAGWKKCENFEGGGCCPVGYECGARNCPRQTVAVTEVVGGLLMQATTTLGEVGKLPQETGEAGGRAVRRGLVAVGVAVAVVGVV